jgi:hypothetical protein
LEDKRFSNERRQLNKMSSYYRRPAQRNKVNLNLGDQEYEESFNFLRAHSIGRHMNDIVKETKKIKQNKKNALENASCGTGRKIVL